MDKLFDFFKGDTNNNIPSDNISSSLTNTRKFTVFKGDSNNTNNDAHTVDFNSSNNSNNNNANIGAHIRDFFKGDNNTNNGIPVFENAQEEMVHYKVCSYRHAHLYA